MSHFPYGFPQRCPWCSTKLPKWKCSYCPSRDEILKIQQNRLDEQETKLIQLRDLQLDNERLRRKNERLRRGCEYLHEKHDKLRAMYYKQVEIIYFLKKFAILQIWKKVVSFLSQQSEDE